MTEIFDFVLRIDIYLESLFSKFGNWIYLILFMIVFAETGFVVTPFLPGDSLLFAVGALSSRQFICPWSSFIILSSASVLGNTLNYHVGRYLGPKVFYKENSKFFNKKHLYTTADFYEKYGALTIAIARFLPLIRSLAPFVAGIGKMKYIKFQFYNIIGSLAWSGSFIGAGYFFGNIPFIKENFYLVILSIITMSVSPTIYKAIVRKRSAHK